MVVIKNSVFIFKVTSFANLHSLHIYCEKSIILAEKSRVLFSVNIITVMLIEFREDFEGRMQQR